MLETYLVKKRRFKPTWYLRFASRNLYVGKFAFISCVPSHTIKFVMPVACSFHNDSWNHLPILWGTSWILWRICFCPNNIFCMSPNFFIQLNYYYYYYHITLSFLLQLPCIMWLALYKPKRFSLSWIVNWVRITLVLILL